MLYTPKSRPRRRALSSILLCALLVNQAGCGPAEDEEETSELQADGKSVGDILGFSKTLQGHLKTVGNIVDAAGGLVGAAGAVKSVLELFGVIESHEAMLLRRLDELEKKMDVILSTSIAGTNILIRQKINEKEGDINAANSALRDYLHQVKNGGQDQGLEYGSRGIALGNLRTAIYSLAGDAFSLRPFDDHTAIQGDWMYAIPDRAANQNYTVYDYRLALPVIVKGIASRILWMSAQDPEFHSNGNFSAELRDYAAIIRAFISKMEAGIRCSPIPAHWTPAHSILPTGCADIHSGISSIDRDWLVNENKKSPIIPYTMDTIAKRHAQRLIADRFNVQLEMGIFQLYSLADKLEKFTIVKFGPKPLVSEKSVKHGVHYWVDTNPAWPGVYYRSSQLPCAPNDGAGSENCTLVLSRRFRTNVSYWVDTNPAWPGVYYAKINSECPYGGSDAGPNCQVISFKSSQ